MSHRLIVCNVGILRELRFRIRAACERYLYTELDARVCDQ